MESFQDIEHFVKTLSAAIKKKIPTKVSQLTNDAGYKTTDTNTTYKLSKSGSTVTLTGSDGSTTSVTDDNATYSSLKNPYSLDIQNNGNTVASYDGSTAKTANFTNATASANGLMSKSDKAKLDGIGAGSNVESVNGKTGAVNLSKADVGLGSVANYDQSKAIKSITRSGTTFTATALDGTTTTFGQQEEKSVTAGIVAVKDADGGDAGLTLNLEPHQSGSGDPSPDNVRPISGFDSVKVVRTGKNLSSVNELADQGPQWAVDQYSIKVMINSLPVGTYVLSNRYEILEMPSSGKVAHGAIYVTATINRKQQPVSRYITVTDSSPSLGKVYEEKTVITITEENKGKINHAYTYCDQAPSHTGVGRGKYKVFDIQIELGTTATGYEPYQGHTYDIAFPSEAGTVYGGSLDVTSGELVVDRVGVAISDLAWTYDSSNTRFTTSSITNVIQKPSADNVLLAGLMSSAYTARAATQLAANDGSIGVLSNGQLLIKDTNYTVASNFVSAMGTQSIVYPLATPQTYQLTPTEVTMLIGHNTIWMDADGKIKLDYKAYAIATKGDVNDHIANKSNPHSVTKAQVGLGSVANLDQSKAIKSITRSGTTFTATALDGTTTTFTQQAYDVATSSADGLMSAADKSKLDGVASTYATKGELNNQISSVKTGAIDQIVNLTAAGWTGDTAPYSQTVNVTGMTDELLCELFSACPKSATVAEREAYNEAFALVASGYAETADGSATFLVDEKPAIDIGVRIKSISKANAVSDQTSEDVTNAVDAMSNTLWEKIYPVGSIYMSVNSTSPASLFGGTWELVGSGKTLWGADSSHSAGTTIEAGLPNITGEVKPDDKDYGWGAGTEASGAFTNYYNWFSHIGGNSWSGNRGNGFTFDASRSNPIYGKSTTVQPPAYVVYMWKRTA